jgi:hypothetical protein
MTQQQPMTKTKYEIEVGGSHFEDFIFKNMP